LRSLGRWPEAARLRAGQIEEKTMPKYVIEREIPGAGKLSAEVVREHASQGGFPANKTSAIRRVIDPITAE
jgi:hypothetical protein